MAERFVLGEESTRSIWGVGELRAMDEVVQRGTSSTTTSPTTNPTSRGVPMREVKAPLVVVTVAWNNRSTGTRCQDAAHCLQRIENSN